MGGAVGLFDAADAFLTGAHTAPTPQISSTPPAEVQPEQWQAPDVSNSGQLVVHRDHLTTASDVLKAHLPELQMWVRNLQDLSGNFDCLASWPQGQQMCQNLMTLVESFAQVGQQTHDAHADAASNLTATAGAYEAAETDSTQAANGVGTPGGSQPTSGQWG